MKKAKSLILSSVLVCLLAVAMILTMVPTNAVLRIDANLKARAVDENIEMEANYYNNYNVVYGTKFDISRVRIIVGYDLEGVQEDKAYAFINARTVKYYLADQEIDVLNYTFDETGDNVFEVRYQEDGYNLSAMMHINVNMVEVGDVEVSLTAPKSMTAGYEGNIVANEKVDLDKITLSGVKNNDEPINFESKDGTIAYWYNGTRQDLDTFTVPSGLAGHDLVMTVKYSAEGKTITTDLTIKVVPAQTLTATYGENIIVGSTINPSQISIQVLDKNADVLETVNAGAVTYWYAGNQINNPINYVFNAVGSLDITVKYEYEDKDLEATMTVNVVEAPVVEEPEPEPIPTPTPTPTPEQPEQPEQPENPSVDQPVVEQPATEDNDGNGLNVGAILGIVFGSLAVLGLGGSLLWIFVFRK